MLHGQTDNPTTVTLAAHARRGLITATTPPMMAVEVLVVGGCVGEHSPSLRDEITTEHSEFTVISTPVTMILAPPLTHSSIREMSEPLSASEVPSSLSDIPHMWETQ